jgi:hypothetical protein
MITCTNWTVIYFLAGKIVWREMVQDAQSFEGEAGLVEYKEQRKQELLKNRKSDKIEIYCNDKRES